MVVAQPQTSLVRQTLNQSDCSSVFIKHQLEHSTKTHGAEVTYYDSNGAGVAVNDLDNDGDLDIVLAQLKGSNSIFWNEGNLAFRKESLSHGNSRAVATADVNADGLVDIVFTQSTSSLVYWQNTGTGFMLSSLKGVTFPAYTMLWTDADNDGDLDLITASYDSLLEKELKDSFLFSRGAGVIYYEQDEGRFKATRLAETSQALAMALFDLNADGTQDLIVGNDFEIPDFIYLNTANGWLSASPLELTTRNTMSFTTGDMNNDGQNELFATDMKPDFNDPKALAEWMPLMQKSFERKTAGQTQLEENFLYQSTTAGFSNVAQNLGIDASGWSWSAKFGDLNNDGLLDLYVVNGMIAKEVFSHLANYELIEENKAFMNRGSSFELNQAWQLNATESGRGMSMADLDNDGDLDIVINNLEQASVIFENQVCEGSALELDLSWDSSNTKALGATVQLETSSMTLTRHVESSSAYLSGDTSRVHFGIPKTDSLKMLTIVWPDGEITTHENLELNTLVTISRGNL